MTEANQEQCNCIEKGKVMEHRFRMYGSFPKNLYFLPPDTHFFECVCGGKNISFKENLTYVPDG